MQDDVGLSVRKTKAKSGHGTGGFRIYRDLVDKRQRFDITKVIRIERSADKNDIGLNQYYYNRNLSAKSSRTFLSQC